MTLLGRAHAQLTADCEAAVGALFNANTAASAAGGDEGQRNARSPKCTLPATLGTTTALTLGEDGSLYTVKTEADNVCPAITETLRHQNMCSQPCEGYLNTLNTACAGQNPVNGDLGDLPDDAVSGTAMTLDYWTNWFAVVRQSENLCSNKCLAYYCANKDVAGVEVSPACSTTTTTVTETSTVTLTETLTATSTGVEAEPATTMAPLAPTTEMSTIAPAAVVAPQGSMPADLAAAQAVGDQAAVIGAAGLLNSYSQFQVVHPGWIVGTAGVLVAAVALLVVKMRGSPQRDELEGLTTAE